MISNAVSIIFGITLSVITLLTIKANGNPSRLTLRGKRAVSVVAFIVGLFIHQIAIHLYWTTTGYTWL